MKTKNGILSTFLKPSFSFIFGLEIEAEVYYTQAENIGDRHDGIFYTKGWTAEEDGSLTAHKKDFVAVEFVSETFSKDQLKQYLERLRAKIEGKYTDTLRFQNIAFNTSMGAHIHYSCNEVELDGKLLTATTDAIRERLFKALKGRIPDATYTAFKTHYYRDYAKKTNLCYISNPTEEADRDRDRSREFTSTSDKGQEWRSFNLQGCKDWETMYIMYKTAIESIETEISKALRNGLKIKQVEYPLIQFPKTETQTTEGYLFLSETQKAERQSGIIIIKEERKTRGQNRTEAVLYV